LYQSPEQIENHPHTDKADVWSLGVLFYEMANFEYPYMANNILALARAIKDQNPFPVNPIYPQLMKDLILCMLWKDRNSRPSMYTVFNSEFFILGSQGFDMLKTLKQTYMDKSEQQRWMDSVAQQKNQA
jgi:serine/threonine protein kinase